MAFSSSIKKHDVHGSLVCQIHEVKFTGVGVTSGHIKTGLSTVVFAVHNNETSASGKVELNRNAADTAAEPGSILLNGFTAEDVGQVMVYGY